MDRQHVEAPLPETGSNPSQPPMRAMTVNVTQAAPLARSLAATAVTVKLAALLTRSLQMAARLLTQVLPTGTLRAGQGSEPVQRERVHGRSGRPQRACSPRNLGGARPLSEALSVQTQTRTRMQTARTPTRTPAWTRCKRTKRRSREGYRGVLLALAVHRVHLQR